MSEVGHIPGGTEFADATSAVEYAQQCHGPDGRILLDPFFIPYLKNLCRQKDVIDIGCGAAPWAIAAIESGANRVLGLDNSAQMIGQAALAVAGKEYDSNAIALVRGNALQIPAQDNSADVALSINVACNLPGVTKSGYPIRQHFAEMARVLRPGGFGVFTAPSSLTTPFTTYGHESDIASLQAKLAGVRNDEQMKKILGGYQDILRATVVGQDNHWRVITEGDGLGLGQPIWRKIPGLVVPNYYHTEDEYERTLAAAGLVTVDLAKPQLAPEVHSAETGLGVQYIDHNAFAVYIVQKPGY